MQLCMPRTHTGSACRRDADGGNGMAITIRESPGQTILAIPCALTNPRNPKLHVHYYIVIVCLPDRTLLNSTVNTIQ